MVTLSSPGKYLQGKGIIKSLHNEIKGLGLRYIILIDKYVHSVVEKKLEEGLSQAGDNYEYLFHNGESTQEEANRIKKIVLKEGHNVIIGVGGGKVLDTAKLVADDLNMPLVIVPTIASSDAPCSAMSVIYDNNGTFIVSKRMKKNPDIVIVDSSFIVEAPSRYLVAGMGDAFATFYEARACHRSGAKNFSGGTASTASYAMAKLCKNLLLKYGVEAKRDVDSKRHSMAVEKIIEANIYLSGVGFENNGCAIAHAIYSGMTSVIKNFPSMHGEAVAYGTIVQLVAEGMFRKRGVGLLEAVTFYRNVGLPLSYKDLGLKFPDDNTLHMIAEATCTKSRNAFNMPFEVTPEVIYRALQKTITILE